MQALGRHMVFFKGVLAGALILLLSSCSTINEGMGGMLDLDTDLRIDFKVDADINPDDNNIPSPLFIRLYELKSEKMFEKATFFDLYEDDQLALGADMTAKHLLKRIKPGEDYFFEITLKEETTHVGLFAELLQYKDAQYKVIVPVVQASVLLNQVRIGVAGNRIYDLDEAKRKRDLSAEEK